MKLAEIFADHMTLQCEKPVRIWGIEEQEEEISVCLNGKEIVRQKIEQGEFSFDLPPQKAQESVELEIGGMCFQDVDFGEVWIAAGQSNMEFLLRYDEDHRNGEPVKSDPHLRFYDVGEYAFPGEKEDGFKDGRYWDRWMSVDSNALDDVEHFSAIGYYFMKDLREALGKPVAIVGCNWGGTTASTWIPKSDLTGRLSIYEEEYEQQRPDLANQEEYLYYDRLIRKNSQNSLARAYQDALMLGGEAYHGFVSSLLKERRSKKNELTAPSTDMDDEAMLSWTRDLSKDEQKKVRMYMNGKGCHSDKRPGGLYETMVCKIKGFSVRGVIWYQGESDDIHPDLYEELFTALISRWRRDFGEGLPFIFAQLAPFDHWLACSGEQYPKLRREQENTALHVKGVYMIPTSDIGNKNDIHPKKKKPVAQRMALKARHYIYGETVPCEYPKASLATWERKENGDGFIRIDFEGCHKLIMTERKEQTQELFQVTKDGELCDIELVGIKGNSLYLRCQEPIENTGIEKGKKKDTTSSKIKISYAQKPYYQVRLYNEIGIPAVPFELFLS